MLDLFSAESEQNKDKIEERAAKMAAQITLIATIGEEAHKNQFYPHYLEYLQRVGLGHEASANPLISPRVVASLTNPTEERSII